MESYQPIQTHIQDMYGSSSSYEAGAESDEYIEVRLGAERDQRVLTVHARG